MINLTMYEGKWRMTISGEIWEYENIEELLKELDTLAHWKAKHTPKINLQRYQ